MLQNVATPSAAKSVGKNYRWFILILAGMINLMLTGYCATSLAILSKQIMEELGWSAWQYANITAAQSLGTTLLILFAGMFLDKFSAKKLLGFSTIFIGIMVGGRMWMNSYTVFYVSMVAFGLGGALYQPSITKITSLWFDKRNMFFANGILISMISVGAILGSRLGPTITTALGGWRPHFFWTGVVIIIIALIWFVFAKDRKSGEAQLVTAGAENTDKTITFKDLWENIKVICSSKVCWILIFSEFFGYGAQHCYTTYASITFMNGWGMAAADVAKLTPMSNYGALLGCLILPYLSDWVGNRKAFVMSGWILRGACAILAILSHNVAIAIPLLFISGLSAGAGIPGARTILMEQPGVGGLRAGTALGLLYFSGRLGNLVIANIYGAIVTATENYVTGEAIAFCFFFVAAFLIFLVPDSGRRAEEKAKKAAEAAAKAQQ